MPRKRFVIIDFHEYGQAELSVLTHTIITMLTTNAAVFPLLPVSVATLRNHLMTYDSILGSSVYPSQTADLDKARKVLDNNLRENGIHINTVGNGNETILNKSGYPLSKQHQLHGALEKTYMHVESLDGGFEIEIVPHERVQSKRTVAKARNYLVLYVEITAEGTVPEDYHEWKWEYFPKHAGKLSKLKRSTKYRLVSTALGTYPGLVFSFPIDRTTQ